MRRLTLTLVLLGALAPASSATAIAATGVTADPLATARTAVTLAPATVPSPGPGLDYESWMQAPGAPFSIGLQHPLPTDAVILAAGDFDGDGLRDVACLELPNSAWSGPPVIEIWRNQDGARFAVAGPLTPHPAGASDLVAVDVDRDGRDDLVVLSDDRLTLFRAGPAGQLQFDHAIDGLSNARRLVAADMNRDGRQDLVVLEAAEVAVFLARGTGFARAFDRPLPLQGYRVAAGDLDGDGWPDVAATTLDHPNPTFVIVYAGRGDALDAPRQFPFPESAPHLAAGDLDGDGRDDLVVESESYAVLLWGAAGFALQSETIPHPGTNWTPRVVVGDMDNDGDNDFAIGHRRFGITVYRNLGGRRFDDTWSLFTGVSGDLIAGPDPTALVFDDLDRDGYGDWLWVPSTRHRSAFVSARGLGGAAYAATVLYAQPGAFGFDFPALEAASFLPWGRPDLIFGNASSTWIMRRRDDGGFDPAEPLALRGRPHAARLDPDALVDLVGAVGDSFYVYGTRPDGTLRAPAGYDGGALMALVDVNGDGAPDALLRRGDDLFVRFNDRHARFDRIGPPFTLPQHWSGASVGDVDGDGRADLLYGVPNFDIALDEAKLMRGAGDGSFVPWQTLDLSVPPHFGPSFHVRTCVVRDLDGDGDADVLVLRLADNRGLVDVFVNRGGGALRFDGVYELHGEELILAVDDWTADGLPDLVSFGHDGTGLGRYHMRFNGGAARFDDWAFQFDGPSYPGSPVGGDFNADGLPDLAFLIHRAGGPITIAVSYNVLNSPIRHPRRGRLDPPGRNPSPEQEASAAAPVTRLGIERVPGRPALALALPGPAPARLELFDLSGRRVWSRRFEGRSGRFEVALPGAPRGIYWGRLTQEGGGVTRRIAILD